MAQDRRPSDTEIIRELRQDNNTLRDSNVHLYKQIEVFKDAFAVERMETIHLNQDVNRHRMQRENGHRVYGEIIDFVNSSAFDKVSKKTKEQLLEMLRQL